MFYLHWRSDSFARVVKPRTFFILIRSAVCWSRFAGSRRRWEIENKTDDYLAWLGQTFWWVENRRHSKQQQGNWETKKIYFIYWTLFDWKRKLKKWKSLSHFTFADSGACILSRLNPTVSTFDLIVEHIFHGRMESRLIGGICGIIFTKKSLDESWNLQETNTQNKCDFHGRPFFMLNIYVKFHFCLTNSLLNLIES